MPFGGLPEALNTTAEVTVQWPGSTGVSESFSLEANKAYLVNPDGVALID